MAIALALTVVCGFAPTYYATFLSGGPKATTSGGPITPLVHLHAALFTSWVLLFIAQTTLVASHRVHIHRRLGVAGAVLAAAMVAVGTSMAIALARRGGAPPGVDPLAFLAIPFFDMVTFTVFVVAALTMRRDREAHKRLMLLAYFCLIVAAVARLPGVLPLGALAYFGLGYSFLLVGVLYDLLSRHRVHAAYIWGGIVLVGSVPLRLMISGTVLWREFAQFLTR